MDHLFLLGCRAPPAPGLAEPRAALGRAGVHAPLRVPNSCAVRCGAISALSHTRTQRRSLAADSQRSRGSCAGPGLGWGGAGPRGRVRLGCRRRRDSHQTRRRNSVCLPGVSTWLPPLAQPGGTTAPTLPEWRGPHWFSHPRSLRTLEGRLVLEWPPWKDGARLPQQVTMRGSEWEGGSAPRRPMQTNTGTEPETWGCACPPEGGAKKRVKTMVRPSSQWQKCTPIGSGLRGPSFLRHVPLVASP